MIERKKGNCVDHSHLAAAMFRVAGIPASYVAKNTKNAGHAWNGIFINKKWIAVDTVIKGESKVMAQKYWVKVTPVKGSYVSTFNYYCDKTINYKNVPWNHHWCDVENRTIYWKDGKIEQIYWL